MVIIGATISFGRLLLNMSRWAQLGVAACCLALATCHYPAESGTPSPSADTFRVESVAIRIGDATTQVTGAAVTSGFFRETKVQPLLGRVFLGQEYRLGSARVVVLGASFWQRLFGGDPGIIGKTLLVDGQQCTIIGILPERFTVPTGTALWLPQQR
jgi:hypothetical protein